MASAELHHFWQHTLTEWATSGLSGAAFCREHRFSYHQFSYWRRKLRAEGESEAGAGFARVAPAATTEAGDGLTGSTPLLRTLLKRGTMCQRSVHVQTQKI